jgi:ubiquinone/menaquinone biosynthesis C-methylase UbiE
MAKTEPFNNHIFEYEQWFEDNKYVYRSEIQAIERVIPENGRGIEIGIGSGLFAKPLGITEGCDPSEKMRKRATEKGLSVIDGIAEKLPYMSQSVDFVLMVTTICFVDDVDKTFEEIKRVLRPNGKAIVAFVDKDSEVGQQYSKHKEKSVFYKDAVFYSTTEVLGILEKHNFVVEKTLQTIFGDMADINGTQHPEKGYGKGSFVVIRATKQ